MNVKNKHHFATQASVTDALAKLGRDMRGVRRRLHMPVSVLAQREPLSVEPPCTKSKGAMLPPLLVFMELYFSSWERSSG